MNTKVGETPGALAGIRVLDLGRVLAAPWATQMLGDLGAQVIKVERPGAGDLGRLVGPAFFTDADGKRTQESSLFLAGNRNKRSITVDLTQPEGQQVIRDLAAVSDVLLENFVGEGLQRFGLDYASIQAVNPSMIYCSISGYGQDGPAAGRPGFDGIFQAHSGIMSVTGAPDDEPGGGPMKIGPSMVDVLTGTNAAVAILAALIHRQRTGEGQHLDITLLDSALAAQAHFMNNYFITGVPPKRSGNSGGTNSAPTGIMKCADGDIYFNAVMQNQYVNLCKALGIPELIDDERFVDNRTRYANRFELKAAIEAVSTTLSKQDVFDRLSRGEVPCSIINDYDEVFADEQVRHRNLRIEMPHPLAPNGVMSGVASPIRMSKTPARYDVPPPLLGEHTDEVLRDVLGYDEARIAALRDSRAI